MRYPAKETAAKHERIVKEASRLFRERGFENVTVGEVMKAAGLTHGAFYAHFGSKQALQEAAVAYGQDLSAARARNHGSTKKGRRSWTPRRLKLPTGIPIFPEFGRTVVAAADAVARQRADKEKARLRTERADRRRRERAGRLREEGQAAKERLAHRRLLCFPRMESPSRPSQTSPMESRQIACPHCNRGLSSC